MRLCFVLKSHVMCKKKDFFFANSPSGSKGFIKFFLDKSSSPEMEIFYSIHFWLLKRIQISIKLHFFMYRLYILQDIHLKIVQPLFFFLLKKSLMKKIAHFFK